MKRFRTWPFLAASVALLSVALLSCGHGHDHPHDDDHDHESGHSHAEGDDHDHGEDEHADGDHADEEPGKPAGISVPAAVRQNLGITFAKAERRPVTKTLRLAGTFELSSSGRQPHHAGLPGSVTTLVQPLERVEAGQLLATISSPTLIERRHELHVASDGVGAADDAATLATERVRAVKMELTQLDKRVKRLKRAGAKDADLETRVTTLRQSLRVLRAEQAARKREVTRAEHRFEAELLGFATVLGVTVAALTAAGASDGDHGSTKPLWESVDHVAVRASAAGVVADSVLSSGAWVETGARIVEVHDPSRVRLVAQAISSDVRRLTDGQQVEVLRTGQAGTGPKAMMGVLRFGTAADATLRTLPAVVCIDSAPSWARPGLTGFVEAVIGGSSTPVVAIPEAALVRDGLVDVFFKRLTDDPDTVIRVEAERGESDGHWVAIKAGVDPGDQIVVDGAYELKLASSEKSNAIGHIHADGSFHKEDH
jgi:hypothetical protein